MEDFVQRIITSLNVYFILYLVVIYYDYYLWIFVEGFTSVKTYTCQNYDIAYNLLTALFATVCQLLYYLKQSAETSQYFLTVDR